MDTPSNCRMVVPERPADNPVLGPAWVVVDVADVAVVGGDVADVADVAGA